jgi:hypothetical protein
VRRLVDEFRASERRICGLMEIPRMSYRYRSRRDDSVLRERLLKLAREKPRFGYRRLWVMLTSNERVNHKRVWRVYRDLGLSVKRTRRKRLERALRPRPALTAPNQEWAVDFVSDVVASGRRLRIFTVVDSYTRECLALEVDTSLPSRQSHARWPRLSIGVARRWRFEVIMGPRSVRGTIWPGASRSGSTPCTFSQANRRRTRTSKASTAGFATSA